MIRHGINRIASMVILRINHEKITQRQTRVSKSKSHRRRGRSRKRKISLVKAANSRHHTPHKGASRRKQVIQSRTTSTANELSISMDPRKSCSAWTILMNMQELCITFTDTRFSSNEYENSMESI